MSAAYGVPLGGALFALEVMRGKLALRFVRPRSLYLVNCYGRLLARAAQRTDLHDSGIFGLCFNPRLGAARWSRRGRRFGRLCSPGPLGRPK
jgi:hypothetical protein